MNTFTYYLILIMSAIEDLFTHEEEEEDEEEEILIDIKGWISTKEEHGYEFAIYQYFEEVS